MDRRVFLEKVPDTQRYGITFAPAQYRARKAAIDGHGGARCAREVHSHLTNGKIEIGASEHIRLALAGNRPHGAAPQSKACKYSACR
ncbi:hypothetical protein D9M71_754410 [compost metagenome]